MEDVAAPSLTERELERRGRILAAIAGVAGVLLRAPSWREAAPEIVGTLGRAAGASRAYLVTIRQTPDGRALARRVHEWRAPGVAPGPAVPELDLLALGLGRFVESLRCGRPVWLPDPAGSAEEKAFLDARGARSILAVPVFVDGEWWGFLALSDHDEERRWSEPEVDALLAVAGALGAAVQRGDAEQALRETTETLEGLVEASPVAIVSLDRRGNVLRWNPAAERIFGWTEAEVLGRFVPYVRDESRDEFLSHLASGFAGERWEGVELRRWRRDGSPVDLSVSTAPIVDPDGRVFAVVVVMTDITSRKQADESLRRREAILAAVNVAAGRLHEAGDWREAIPEVLAELGEAAAASRVHLFEHRPGRDGRVVARRVGVWLSSGVADSAEGFQSFAYDAVGIGAWLHELRSGEPVQDHVRNLPEPARGTMSAHGTRSALMVPVLVDGALCGAFGFEACEGEYVWGPAETDAIRTAGSTLAAAIERQRAEESLRGREAILRSVSLAAGRLLRAGSWREVADEVLEILGQAATASRAYLFEAHEGEAGERLVSIRYEWTAAGVQPLLGERALARICHDQLGLGWWEDRLRAGEVLHQAAHELAEPMRSFLAKRGVRAMLAVPIFAGEDWWGFVAFDDCVAERTWTPTEVEALRLAAGTLGGAMQREQMEQALRRSDENYRHLFDANPSPSWVFDRETLRLLAVNEAAVAHYGYSHEEFLGLTLLDLRPEEDWKEFTARLVARPAADRGLFRHVKKDGTRILVESRVEDVLFEGRRAGLAVLHDVTERERALEALRRREAILGAVSFAAERLLGASRWQDAAGEVLRILADAARASRCYLFEAHEGESGERLVSVRHEWAAPGIAPLRDSMNPRGFAPDSLGGAQWQDALVAGEPIHATVAETPEPMRSILAAQGVRSLLMVPVVVNGEHWGLLGFHDCVAERRWGDSEIDAIRAAADILGGAIQRQQVREELVRSEAKYRVLFDANPNPAYVFDRETLRFLEVNDAAVEHYGWSREEFLGMTILDIRPAGDRAALAARLATVGKGTDQALLRHLKREGEEIAVEVRARNDIPFEGRRATLVMVDDVTERLRMERALADSEERLRALVENLPGIVYRADADGRTMRFLSEHIEDVVGRPASELLGDPRAFSALIHPDDRSWVAEAVAAGLRSGEPCEIEYRVLHADGSVRWVSERAQPVADEHGESVWLDGVIFDVTARKRAERELADALAVLDAIVENIPAALFMKDARDLRLVRVNRAAEDLFGWSREDVLGKDEFSLLPAETAASLRGQERKILDGRAGAGVWEEELQTARGVWLHTRKVPILDEDGFPRFLLGIGVDVTERRRAAAELERLLAGEQVARAEVQAAFGRIARQQERLRKLLLTVAELTVDDVSELERLICAGAREALGARYAALSVLGPDGTARERLVVSVADGQELAPEGLPEEDGVREVPIEAAGRRWGSLYLAEKTGGFDLEDELLAEMLARYVGQAVTNAQLYRSSLEQNERLLALDRMKDEFVALVSHELRTPLTSIIGYLELVRDEEAGGLTEEQARFLGIVERNAQRLLSLVADLLFVAQISAGKLTIDPAPFDLASLALECIETAQPRAAAKQIELAFHGERVAGFEGDRGRLGQLLDNLVSNAIKFTPEGGQVQVLLARDGDRIRLDVSDTGMGIPREEQEQLFERFYRTKGATRKAIQGTGLGLVITKAIAEAHGGRIWVESEEGAGATFHVELPLAGPGAGNGAGGEKVDEAA